MVEHGSQGTGRAAQVPLARACPRAEGSVSYFPDRLLRLAAHDSNVELDAPTTAEHRLMSRCG